ncbi:hypothetical protein CH352_01605 [Leptospira hartskeerlii]|uniref:Uncharacterized protein n=1 Tax=Leptospira hartskeerlii TaxID=2023177 RepID=A0A2M9XE27_9LEPT|nr:hypothetical protein CH357_09370 [Leptospira hartskeerlii]PJZ35345.1 hypothetical protein CH352_01605 [Leptospira hartskeerlii]
METKREIRIARVFMDYSFILVPTFSSRKRKQRTFCHGIVGARSAKNFGKVKKDPGIDFCQSIRR